ncbi:ABC-three component system middle component 7 [Methylotetracoccus oryzae]|uniref:ABC-three component system middle component 7 n=1 Tax=Methylotetracoccus oryzae TaxID=1919059 RepID=UPI001119621A
MIVPNKFVSLDESLIAKLPHLLANLKDGESVLELYSATRDVYADVGEFLLSLDVLFVLGRIRVDVVARTVHLC